MKDLAESLAWALPAAYYDFDTDLQEQVLETVVRLRAEGFDHLKSCPADDPDHRAIRKFIEWLENWLGAIVDKHFDGHVHVPNADGGAVCITTGPAPTVH